MREILFRGKTPIEADTYDGGEWVEGFYTRFNGKEHRIYSGYAETDCGDYYPDWFNVIPETVGQFTGVYDKNGKRIFEGDVIKCTFISPVGSGLRFTPRTETVVYREGCFNPLYDCKRNSFEVIGNVHDNPELLKEMAEQ